MTFPPDPLELAFLSHVEYLRELTRLSDGTVLDTDGITCCASPHPLPGLVNGVFRTNPAAPAALVLERARSFFALYGRSVPVSALAGRDDDLIAFAVGMGWSAGDPNPFQVLGRQRLDQYDVAGVDFRRVTDGAGVHDYTAVCRQAHATYGFSDDLFPTIFARPETMLAPHIHAFVGYTGADPVATGTLFLTHGVAYVGWIAVVPSFWRRGLGAAATATVVNAGFELGATCSTLMASPMGAAVYRRLGFADAGGLVDLEPQRAH